MFTPELTAATQELALALIASDGAAGPRLEMLLPPTALGPYYGELAEAAAAYRKRYGRPAGEHLLDLAEKLAAARPDRADAYRRVVASVRETVGRRIDPEFVLTQAETWARYRRVRAGLAEALDALESKRENALDLACAAMLAAARDPGHQPSLGLGLTDLADVFRAIDNRPEVFPVGVSLLDEVRGGTPVGGVSCQVALQNRGKTWHLVNHGLACARERLRVVHYTLELQDSEVILRYLQAALSLASHEAAVKVRRFARDNDGVAIDWTEEELQRPTVGRSEAEAGLETLRRFGDVLVAGFPMATFTVDALEGHLDTVEGVRGWRPDLVIVDYPELMRLDRRDYRVSIGHLYQELKGLAQRRRLAVAVASQANRAASNKRWITEFDVAEDVSKISTCDAVITYSQTKPERDRGLARLWLTKNRNGPVGRRCFISQAYAIGQYVVDAAAYNDRLADRVDADVGGPVDPGDGEG